MEKDVRWIQRFDNFHRAFLLLNEVRERGIASLSQLEKEGAVQRFEFTFELAWKTLGDYLRFNGVVIEPLTPRNIIKEAYSAGIIDDAQLWIDMMLHRNLLSHTYDNASADAVLEAVDNRYVDGFRDLNDFFQNARSPG